MGYYLGIDLGGTNIAVGIVDAHNKIIARRNRKTNTHQSFESLVMEIAITAKEAVECAGLKEDDVDSVGMGTPSCINPKTGNLVNANNLGWINVPLRREIQKYFLKKVAIANDADCAALGEVTAGSASGYQNAIMITLGTGVGGGIIQNGKIYSGADGMGSEIGHIKLIYGGKKCSCGQKGCFEAYASATALIQQTKEAAFQNKECSIHLLSGTDPEKIDAKTVFDAAHRKDETALEVLDQYYNYLAGGISTLITLYRPEVIIIGGGISNQGECLIKPLKEKIYEQTFAAKEIGIPELRVASLGNDAGIIGAAKLGYLENNVR